MYVFKFFWHIGQTVNKKYCSLKCYIWYYILNRLGLRPGHQCTGHWWHQMKNIHNSVAKMTEIYELLMLAVSLTMYIWKVWNILLFICLCLSIYLFIYMYFINNNTKISSNVWPSGYIRFDAKLNLSNIHFGWTVHNTYCRYPWWILLHFCITIIVTGYIFVPLQGSK